MRALIRYRSPDEVVDRSNSLTASPMHNECSPALRPVMERFERLARLVRDQVFSHLTIASALQSLVAFRPRQSPLCGPA